MDTINRLTKQTQLADLTTLNLNLIYTELFNIWSYIRKTHLFLTNYHFFD